MLAVVSMAIDTTVFYSPLLPISPNSPNLSHLVGTRRGASASTFLKKKCLTQIPQIRRFLADKIKSRGFMRLISGKVSQITQITQIAIRAPSVESMLSCGINVEVWNQLKSA